MIDYNFSAIPIFDDYQNIINTYTDASTSLKSTFYKTLSLLSAKINVKFIESDSPEWTLHLATFSKDYGGYTYWSAPYADIYIRSSDQANLGLMLHEVGHALGLEHSTESTSIMRANLSSASLAKITNYSTYDWSLLNSIYGSSETYKGDWTGTSYNDRLYGGKGAVDPADNSEKLYGMGGSDTLYGNGGNDTIYGGSGIIDPQDSADTIYGGSGIDYIYGNGGNDVIYGDSSDVIYGGAGADTYYSTTISNFLDFNASEGDKFILL